MSGDDGGAHARRIGDATTPAGPDGGTAGVAQDDRATADESRASPAPFDGRRVALADRANSRRVSVAPRRAGETAGAATRATPVDGVVPVEKRGTARAARKADPPPPDDGPGGPTAPREPAERGPLGDRPLGPTRPSGPGGPGFDPPLTARGGTSLVAAPFIAPVNCTSGIRRTGTALPVMAAPAPPGQ